MENKYYTPDIEEFYVGFECEYYNDYSKQWYNHIMDKDDWYVDEYGEYNESNPLKNIDNLRIKCLDSEDIESLGFKKSYAPSYITDEIIELYSIGNEEDWYNLEFQDNNIIITKCHIYNEVTGNWNQDCIFMGVVKNKSELKKLLTQLGIN